MSKMPKLKLKSTQILHNIKKKVINQKTARNNSGILTLSDVQRGNYIKIVRLPHGLAKSQMIRFGFIEGETVKCLERLPGGTVLIQKKHQEIAIGVKLARQIIVAAD
jgi:Fe2+ transport system protein FeoA